MITRSDRAEVAGIEDYLESRFGRGQARQDSLSAISGSIIDYDDLVGVFCKRFHGGTHLGDKFLDIFRFVKAT